MKEYELCSYKNKYRRVLINLMIIITLIFLSNSNIAKAEERVSVGGLRKEVVQCAENCIGKPYIYGAEGPDAFDCSGLTKYVYERFNVDLPHYTGNQWSCGKGICKNQLKEGDLVFFNTSGNLSHVGLYIGENKFIHAPSKGKNVKVSSLNEEYYRVRYAGARRII